MGDMPSKTLPLSHYFAGCTWLSLRFDLGMFGPVCYAVVLAIAIISVVQASSRHYKSLITNNLE